MEGFNNIFDLLPSLNVAEHVENGLDYIVLHGEKVISAIREFTLFFIEMCIRDSVGTMNVMFVIGDEVLTPALTGTILPGITRDSVLTLLRDWGVKATERRITLDELQAAAKNGQLREAFGVGTAAVISPIGEFNIRGERYKVGNGGIGLLSQKIYTSLTDIQWGRAEDKYGWTVEVK